MLQPKILEALNKQISHEENNSRIYLQMSAWCEANGYRGCAKWFHASYEDELKHKKLIESYVIDRNCKFELSAISAPPCEFSGIQDLFDRSLALERKTTAALKELYKLTMTSGDYLTSEFLLQLLREQVEEEDKVLTMLDYIKLAGTTPPGLAMIDDKASA